VTRPLAALTAALAALASTTTLASPASGAGSDVAVPVSCSRDKVVIEWDDLSYDLSGPCGVVVIEASNVHVTMPTATRLVVDGRHNVVRSKPVTTLVLRGRDHDVRVPSVRRLRGGSPGTELAVDGLVEDARLMRRGTALTADRITGLVVRGDGHRVRSGHGYDARLVGDDNRVVYGRLEELTLTGDGNRVAVREGGTAVHDVGSHNRVS
jgi:hypothetical protein